MIAVCLAENLHHEDQVSLRSQLLKAVIPAGRCGPCIGEKYRLKPGSAFITGGIPFLGRLTLTGRQVP
jgi:hypothetical protein